MQPSAQAGKSQERPEDIRAVKSARYADDNEKPEYDPQQYSA